MNISPEIGATGRYVIRSPYNSIVSPNVLYTCRAKRTFNDCEKRGESVYDRYYKPFGFVDGTNGFSLDRERTNGVIIISLFGQDGTVAYVPSNYIESFPDQSGVLYNHVIMSCSLGALPSTFNATAAMQALKSQVQALTGVTNPAVELHLIPVTENPTMQEATVMENTRQGNITVNKSPQQELDEANAENARLRTHINELMTVINSLGGLN